MVITLFLQPVQKCCCEVQIHHGGVKGRNVLRFDFQGQPEPSYGLVKVVFRSAEQAPDVRVSEVIVQHRPFLRERIPCDHFQGICVKPDGFLDI